MLAFAGMPFIMGNASEELRGQGWPVTRTNAENGVAAAIEQVLGPSSIGVLSSAGVPPASK
jgi:hydroxymethylpyrimidine pyrophosphatase-like HAD family hydrolase